MGNIILASQSPRRKQLLEWADVPFIVRVSDADESYPAGLTFPDIAVHIAENKASAIMANAAPDDLVIAADTIVVCDGLVIGKPVDKADAVAILKKLSGNEHTVYTGVCITNQQRRRNFADATKVWFHPLSHAQIEYYVDKYKPYDKAGAYAIQEWIGVVGIKKIDGDFYNVMGLPVSRVVAALREFS